MKKIILSIVISIAFHILYFICTIGWAYMKTIFENDFIKEYNNAYILQNEVGIGFVGSPVFLLDSILSVAIVVLLIMKLTNHYTRKRKFEMNNSNNKSK